MKNRLSKRGFGISDILENWNYQRNIKFSDFLNIFSKKKTNYLCVSKLSPILDFINEQFNQILTSQLFVLNSPNGIQVQQSISRKQIEDLEEIYLLFDEDGKGYIEMDRILLLFQVLLFADYEAMKLNRDDFLTYKKQFSSFCEQLGVYEGKLSIRQFKQYFVINQLATDKLFQQIKYYFYSFVGLQRFKLVDKVFYFSFALSSREKSLWIQNIKIRENSSTMIKEFQKEKKFNKLIFENMILCEQYIRIIYLFLVENFESLKYYFELQKKIDLQFFSQELTRIFNSCYSENQAVLTMIDNINNLFYIFTDVYLTIFRENSKIFSNIYSQFVQEKQMSQSQNKQVSFKSSIDQQNSVIKNTYLDLEIPDYMVNKNKPENYIFERRNVFEDNIYSNNLESVTSLVERDFKQISPIKTHKQSSIQQSSPLKQNTFQNISYLTSPQLRSNHHIFSPINIKFDDVEDKNPPISSDLGFLLKLQQTQSVYDNTRFSKQYSSTSTGTPSKSVLIKTQSLSPQKSSFSYNDYLRQQKEKKDKIVRQNAKSTKIQSMVKIGWEEESELSEEQSSQRKMQSSDIYKVYQKTNTSKSKKVN